MLNQDTFEGGCTCRHIRYRMTSKPMFVHCCHCTWCQRETGTAFALNAMIEGDRVELLNGDPEVVDTPSASGKGQLVSRCPRCHVTVWSNYAGSGDKVKFLRIGTLDAGHGIGPDIHIFTSTKQPWITLSGDVPVMQEYYKPKEQWPAESQARFKALRP